MTATVLVVDDLAPNVKLLEAKLRAEYFEVITSLSGHEAIELAKQHHPDIVLLDVMMPGIDGFEVCRILKEEPTTAHIPVVMVTALDQQTDRLAGLKSGADDFLTKPVQDLALFARVRSLSRLKQMTDELRAPHTKGAELGAIAAPRMVFDETEESRVTVITDDPFIDGLDGDTEGLPGKVVFEYRSNVRETLDEIRENAPDLVMVDLSIESHDPLRLCSAIRACEGARLMPLLALAREGDTRTLVRALDIGVTDYLMRPVDSQEMAARVRTQLRRKRYVEQLRDAVQESMEMSVTDPLTKLYNRRYLSNQLPRLLEEARRTSTPLSIMMLDVDRFKKVNDTLGHDVGDIVLKDIGQRLSHSVRGMDLACRYGGEEFMFVMPGSSGEDAGKIAERVRREIAAQAVPIPGAEDVPVTVSIGVATADLSDPEDTIQNLIKRADDALYGAKSCGRNQVKAAA